MKSLKDAQKGCLLYGVMHEEADYASVKFFEDKAKALKAYSSAAKEGEGDGTALFEITGSGEMYMSYDASGDGKVKLMKSKIPEDG